MYRYSYEQTKCPDCNTDLTQPKSVEVTLNVLGTPVYITGNLADEGTLEVDDEGLIAKGHHAGTECNACSECLSGIESSPNEFKHYLWVAIYHHKYGIDLYSFVQEESPGDDDVVKVMTDPEDFNSNGEEWIEYRNMGVVKYPNALDLIL